MRVLLDTHILLWAFADPDRLPRNLRSVLEDPATNMMVSVISVWEIVIKFAKGALKLPVPPETYLQERFAFYGIQVLPLTLAHTLAVQGLAPLHSDPFDRALIAQSRVERIPLLTVDAQVLAYGGFDIELR